MIILKTKSTRKPSIPRKPNNCIPKKESIKNCIVRMNMNEASEQKKLKITTLCSFCRKTCELINSHETLKNIHNGKEVKKLDGENCRTANVVHAGR